jgi:hypothetical protein
MRRKGIVGELLLLSLEDGCHVGVELNGHIDVTEGEHATTSMAATMEPAEVDC